MGNLRHHLETHSKDRERKFSFDSCGKLYMTAKAAAGHKGKVHREKNFKCDVCGKAFSNLPALDGHMFFHIRNKE